MNRFVRMFAVAAMLICAAPGHSADVPTQSPVRAIPFKVESASVEEQGTKIIGILVALLAATAGGLFFLRRKLQGSVLADVLRQRMRVVERLRVNSTLTMYLVRVDEREIVVMHGGNSISQFELQTSTATTASSMESKDA